MCISQVLLISFSLCVTLIFFFLPGVDPLQQALFEADTVVDKKELKHVELVPTMWRYRTPVSLENLRRQMYERSSGSVVDSDARNPVLRLFMREVRGLIRHCFFSFEAYVCIS